MIDGSKVDSTARKHVRGLVALAAILAGGVALVFLLTGCGTADREPTVRGVVVAKDYDAAVPKSKVTRAKPADYDLTIRPDGAPQDGSQDVEVDVTRSEYNKYEIGDRYPK